MKTEPEDQIIKIKVGIPDTETGCEIKKDVLLCKTTRKQKRTKNRIGYFRQKQRGKIRYAAEYVDDCKQIACTGTGSKY